MSPSPFQVQWLEDASPESDAERVRVTESSVNITGLKGSTVYLVSVRAHNSAGTGPSSAPISITTKKPRKSGLLSVLTMHSSTVVDKKCIQGSSHALRYGKPHPKLFNSISGVLYVLCLQVFCVLVVQRRIFVHGT